MGKEQIMNTTSYKVNNQTMDANNQIKRLVITVLISMAVVQQMPIIRDLYYDQFRAILYLSFGLFGLLSFLSIRRFLKCNLIKHFVIALMYALLLSVFSWVLGKSTNPFLELLIPFGMLVCSLNTSFSKSQLSKLLIWYVVLASFLAISSIFYYGHGFVITPTYVVPAKNQIGPIVGIASIIAAILVLNKKQFKTKHNYWIVNLSLFLVLTASILVIRNRSSIVAIIIILIPILIKEYKPKKTINNFMIAHLLLIVLLLLFVFGVFNGLIDFVWKSMTLNYDVTDMQSLSAGRTDVYKMALRFVLEYPIFGEIGSDVIFDRTPHNYILNNWVRYGVVGSMPLVIFYLYLWFFSIQGIIFNKFKNNFSLPLWVLLFSLIVSIFEYTYPYGPGTSQVMLWFLIGQYLVE